MQITPLEYWISEKICCGPEHKLTPEDIRRHQGEKLKMVIDYVRDRSPYYREQLRTVSGKDLQDVNDLTALPMTTAEDLQRRGPQFLCLSQSKVERVVTLRLPQRAETPRRISFSAQDLELTVDFFHHGMKTLVQPGQRVLILMPGERPGSVGDLLARSLTRAGARGFVHGIVENPALTIREIIEREIDCVVGIPTQVLSLTVHKRAREIPPGMIKSVLLSADYVPSSLVREIQRAWQCKVFGHYGTTEMGFGGGVECEAFDGYHLREADLLFEIVDPISGRPLADGQAGEVVFTTLTRDAMPLIRYRTGDLSGFLPDPCPCGTVLRRLDKVKGKVNEMVRLRSGGWLGIADLDEVLFSVPGMENYQAFLTKSSNADHLEVSVHGHSPDNLPQTDRILEALISVPVIGHALETGHLTIEPIRFSADNWVTTGAAKRTILL